MYIALVCPYDLRRPGGVRSHIAGLGRALVAGGHRVDVIAPSDATDLESLPVVACGRSRGLPFGGTQIDMTWAAWTEVADVARRGYDVMHFHTIWNPAMPFQLAAAYRGPKVATFHDVPGRDTPALAAAAMAPAAALIRATLLDAVIAVSPGVGAYLERDGHEVIPNGISVPALPPERERDAVLYLGRLEPRKGVATLLDAAARLGDAGPRVWIAGDGPLRSELQGDAATRGLTRVEFFGEVTEKRKWELLRQTRFLVATSTGGESFGIVLVEAMAAGAIPIASDIPGYRGVLRGQADSLLFPPSDARALGDRLRELAASDTSGLRAWSDAEWTKYDWRALTPRVTAVYERAIKAHTART